MEAKVESIQNLGWVNSVHSHKRPEPSWLRGRAPASEALTAFPSNPVFPGMVSGSRQHFPQPRGHRGE